MANTENSELDLTHLGRKAKQYYGKAGDSFFDGILFVKRNIILIAIIFIIGAGLGVFMDKGSKVYTHKIFVIPNFESVDYLYQEVERLDAKTKELDKSYLASLGIKNPEHFRSIEIEPVVDIYEFVDEARADKMNQRLDLFKIIAEKGDINAILEDDATGKNYKYQLITITTNNPALQSEIIDPLLKHLNSAAYYKEIQQEFIKNNDLKIVANDIMIKQIDSVLSDFNKGSRSKSAGLMYYNDNTELNELINVKNSLVREQGRNRINKIDYSSIIKDTGIVPNIRKTNGANGKMKFIVPILFLLIFFFVVRFRNFYKKQTLKRSQQTIA